MQGLLVYIRNRYQTTKLRRIQICVISEDALDLHSSIRPHVLIFTLLHCGLQLIFSAVILQLKDCEILSYQVSLFFCGIYFERDLYFLLRSLNTWV